MPARESPTAERMPECSPSARHEVAGPHSGRLHPGRVLRHVPDASFDQHHARVAGGLLEGAVQDGTTHPQPRAVTERGFSTTGFAVEVANSLQREPGQRPGQLLQRPDGARHQPLAAGLVHRARPLLDDHRLEAGAGGVQGGGQARGSPADDQDVDHAGSSVRSALSSARIRTRNNAALSTVNTAAVTHAVCTSGSATPSATTAT